MTGRRPGTPPWIRRLLVVLLVAVAVAGCGGDQPGSVTWRDITFEPPDEWYLIEQTDDRLSIANQRQAGEGDEATPPDGDLVAMHFTYEPSTLPDDWRRFVEQQDATLETDDRLTLDGEVPATRLVFSHVSSGGVPTREMVVVIPSRGIVVLALPVPPPGAQDAPEVFLRHVEDFLGVFDTVRFSAPIEE